MVEESNPIHIPDESELGIRIREAAASGEPLSIELDGEVYTVSVTEETETLQQPPSPEQVARSIADTLAVAGSWEGLMDPEEFKAYIRERRRIPDRRPVES